MALTPPGTERQGCFKALRRERIGDRRLDTCAIVGYDDPTFAANKHVGMDVKHIRRGLGVFERH